VRQRRFSAAEHVRESRVTCAEALADDLQKPPAQCFRTGVACGKKRAKAITIENEQRCRLHRANAGAALTTRCEQWKLAEHLARSHVRERDLALARCPYGDRQPTGLDEVQSADGVTLTP
jgi:hypothetical protein